jgi:hypothetical protein
MTGVVSALIIGHTVISVFATLVGAAAIADLLRSRPTSFPISAFLALATATSVSGFFLPLPGVSPAVVIGIIALAVLAAVMAARGRLLTSAFARWIFAGGIVASHYLLVFVAIAQSFTKIEVLQRPAPTQSEPPFAIAQLLTLTFFVGLGILTVVRFRPGGVGRASIRPATT